MRTYKKWEHLTCLCSGSWESFLGGLTVKALTGLEGQVGVAWDKHSIEGAAVQRP